MKDIKRIIQVFILFGSLSAGTHFSASGQAARSPNIVLILTDDLGWSCLSVSMHRDMAEGQSDFHQTPHLDRLVQQGMRFSRGYAPAAICSPSRRSIQFGQTPARQGDTSFAGKYSPPECRYQAIPQALKALDPGYRTAHFGKWDLRAGIYPEDLAYDESDGNTGNTHGDVMTDKGEKWDQHFIVSDPKRMFTLTGRALNFMKRQVNAGNPFFLQVSHYAPHVDIQTRQKTYEKYKAKSPGEKHSEPGWAGMLEDLDQSIGELLEGIKALGIENNTYIFFLSDNGAAEFIPPVSNRLDHPSSFERKMRNYPLRGGKWTLYEGGIRVPFVVKGPGISPGTQCDVPVVGWDLLATFQELAGGKSGSNPELDGVSFAPLLRQSPQVPPALSTRSLFFHRYHQGYPHSAIVEGKYKLLKFWKSGKTELYALDQDPGETVDLAKKMPAVSRNLEEKLLRYLKEVNPPLVTKSE